MTAALALIAGLFVGFVGGYVAGYLVAASDDWNAAGTREPERNP